MTDIDVHALAAMKGFGVAGEEIRKNHDPHWGLGEKGADKKTYMVDVFIEGDDTIEVEAYSESEAKALALEAAGDDIFAFAVEYSAGTPRLKAQKSPSK